jgi:hypothetical protein
MPILESEPMRTLALLACSLISAAALAGGARAVDPANGTLSVARGKGVVVLELRGSILGRLGSGSLTVTDLTPRDRYTANVVARKMKEIRVIGPRTTRYRGQGIRFRMLGGGYRVVTRGTGIALSAVGKGFVTLDGERATLLDDAGVYSLDGVDCSDDPASCTPLPDNPERYPLGTP